MAAFTFTNEEHYCPGSATVCSLIYFGGQAKVILP
jgi:hypothetical protein